MDPRNIDPKGLFVQLVKEQKWNRWGDGKSRAFPKAICKAGRGAKMELTRHRGHSLGGYWYSWQRSKNGTDKVPKNLGLSPSIFGASGK